MKRKHFPKILIPLMIVSLVFLQSYPLAAVLAEDLPSSSSDKGSNSSDSSSDSSSDNSDSKKDDGKSEDSEKKDSSGAEDRADPEKKDSPSQKNDSSKDEEVADDSSGQDKAAPVGEDDDSVGNVVNNASNDQNDDPAPDPVVNESLPDNNTNNQDSPILENQTGPATQSDDGMDNSSSGSKTDNAPENIPPVEQVSGEADSSSGADPALDDQGAASAAEDDGGSLSADAPAPLAEEIAADDTTMDLDQVVTNENDTTAINTAETAASSGDNVSVADSEEAAAEDGASSGDPAAATADGTQPVSEEGIAEETADAAIATDPANATTVIENNVNTNVTTENGTVSNFDIYDYTGDIDLLKAFQAVLDSAKKVTDSNAEAISLTIHNVNDAVVENDASTSASTGGNSADANDGTAEISTGDASAITDIVNYINTNIVGNNWLYVTLNIFGNWDGDLIVPGYGLLTLPNPTLPNSLDVANYNSAEVSNDVETVASTGGNVTEGGVGGAIIQTGTATSEANVTNIVDTNIVQNNWFLLLFNNMGTWTGKLLNWGGESSGILSYDFSIYGDSAQSSLGSLSVINENYAQVTNNVTTTASTGGNSATGSQGTSVTTGNAFSFSNIFNMINTNIVGDNWFFGIINNMGNWKGDVEFAYPDLAVILSDNSTQVSPGDKATYTIHYKNLGRADSGPTKIKLDLPSDLKADKNEWSLSGLKSGQEGAIDVSVKVDKDVSSGETLAATAEISTETAEVNLDNNSSTDEIGVYDPKSSENEDLNSKIVIKRSTTAKGNASPGDHVKNTIIIENKSDNPIYNVSLGEEMRMPDNTKLVDFSWPIGDMKKGGKVMVEYDFIVNNPGQEVEVNYVARATGQDVLGEDIKSSKASSVLTVLGFALAANAQVDAVQQQQSLVAGAEILSNEPKDLNFPNPTRPNDNSLVGIWLAALAVFFLIKSRSFLWKMREAHKSQ